MLVLYRRLLLSDPVPQSIFFAEMNFFVAVHEFPCVCKDDIDREIKGKICIR